MIEDFGTTGIWVDGVWLYNNGSWSQVSGSDASVIVPANTDADPAQELVLDFITLGVWVWNGGAWLQIS
jgi:hypothetical protein